VVITLLLTTGARHPWRVDAKYLARRNLTVEDNDPFNITVYQLKELIWRDWRQGTQAHSFLFRRVGWPWTGCMVAAVSVSVPVSCH
jgi:hypothetical protein